MRRRRTSPARSTIVAVAVAAALLTAAPAVGAADPAWRLEQPAPPVGAPFKVSLGAPGDLAFWAPNRGLLTVEGNSLIPRGLFVWNGRAWRQFALVCGGSADTARIAWAGPTEFWVVSAPSRPRIGNGIALCHFKDGQVVASYATLPQASDPYQVMSAAACAGPDDCWFGGPAAEDPAGSRRGAFRLHWDGKGLTTSYGPQGRGISDLDADGGAVIESVFSGPGPEDRRAAVLDVPEPDVRLLHTLSATGVFTNDPFVAAPVAGSGPGASELLALDSGGGRTWAVGGGAASGPAAPPEGAVARPPLVVTRLGAGAFTELPLVAPPEAFGPADRLVDVGALPGTDDAWAAVQPFGERGSVNARARVARIDAATGAASVQQLPAAGGGRGSAVRLACPAADQCWMATRAGWLFHFSDGTPLPLDTEPTLQGLVTFRPNESAAQFVPDAAPIDDSLLLAPPPVEVQPVPAAGPTTTRRLKPLIRGVRKPSLQGTTLVLRFRLTRRASVQLVARRRGTVVAKTRVRRFRAGAVVLRLKLDRRRWPTQLKFVVRERGTTRSEAPGGSDTVTTGGGSTVTSAGVPASGLR